MASTGGAPARTASEFQYPAAIRFRCRQSRNRGRDGESFASARQLLSNAPAEAGNHILIFNSGSTPENSSISCFSRSSGGCETTRRIRVCAEREALPASTADVYLIPWLIRLGPTAMGLLSRRK